MKNSFFIKYFFDFYGPKGLYPETLPNLTAKQVELGIALRGKQFKGDSFDRESIRDMILVVNNRLGGVFEINIGKSLCTVCEKRPAVEAGAHGDEYCKRCYKKLTDEKEHGF